MTANRFHDFDERGGGWATSVEPTRVVVDWRRALGGPGGGGAGVKGTERSVDQRPQTAVYLPWEP
jgi:hypothetical protein